MSKFSSNSLKEKEVVKNYQSVFEKCGFSNLKKVFTHQNLATLKFKEIWREWWESEAPPKVEIDMIFVFANSAGSHIAGTEVKYFKSEDRKFCEGLQQTLSLALFGFDSLVLWHIFSQDMKNKEIESIVKPTEELIKGFTLPLVYFATKQRGDYDFEFFAPLELYSSQTYSAYNMLARLYSACQEKPNPLLRESEVIKRREMLRVILKIPV